jgi:hypothetical protein
MVAARDEWIQKNDRAVDDCVGRPFCCAFLFVIELPVLC